jgi:hypothetical protein
MDRGRTMKRAISLLFASGLLLADCTPEPGPYLASDPADPYFVEPGYDFGWQHRWERGLPLHSAFGWQGYRGGRPGGVMHVQGGMHGGGRGGAGRG